MSESPAPDREHAEALWQELQDLDTRLQARECWLTAHDDDRPPEWDRRRAATQRTRERIFVVAGELGEWAGVGRSAVLLLLPAAAGEGEPS